MPRFAHYSCCDDDEQLRALIHLVSSQNAFAAEHMDAAKME